MDAEKILTILVEIYCRQEGLTLKSLSFKRVGEDSEEEKSKNADAD